MSREKLLERIDGKREELTDLTCELVRIPTVNPPGDAYTDCAHFLGTRLEKRGFEIGYHRAEGTPGDNDRYQERTWWQGSKDKHPGPVCISMGIWM